MSLDFAVRLIGMVVFAFGGLRLGLLLASQANDPPDLWGLVIGLTGALFGLIMTPHISVRPASRLRDQMAKLPPQQLVSGMLGLLVGLIVAALLSLPLAQLPAPYGNWLPLIVAIACGYMGVSLFMMRRRDIFDLFGGSLGRLRLGTDEPLQGAGYGPQVLLDTSVIIDGRIADISRTGFIMGAMLVPRFVLNELHHIADSPDPIRRNRGRRGIEILNDVQQNSPVPVIISDLDIEDIETVDEKLIQLARQLSCTILTNDYNLNRIADLQGVTVLNINELANAVRMVFLPGEEMDIQVIQDGRELGQGVGYLDDGTMVVIEGGKRHVGQQIRVVVTKVLQTSAGRMIFGRPIQA